MFSFKINFHTIIEILTDVWLNTNLVETVGMSPFDKVNIKSVISQISAIEHVLYQYHLFHF